MEIIEKINSILWGPILIPLLIGTGIFYTIRLRFVQRLTGKAYKQVFKNIFSSSGKADESGMSSFQALATAVAAQVGTGNLTGVATALAAGGPGAIFWMWISAFFGMGTNFAEAVLGQLYKTEIDGHVTGGPAYYIRHGVKSKFLAGFFAVAIILALGFMGNVVQSNSIVDAANNVIDIPPIIIGILVAIVVGAILVGGISSIASFTEKVVPIMATLYILGSVCIIFLNITTLLPALKSIIVGAFSPQALGGGLLGITVMKVIRYGVARGLFSNEAGMGSTPHAHAVAKVSHPAEQGLVALFGITFDTMIICTLTALVILTSGAMNSGATGIALTQLSFETSFGRGGTLFIAIAIFSFALTTIVGWYYFGESNIRYLFGSKSIPVYKCLVLACIIIGSTLKVAVVWELADMFNGFMVLPNLIALLILSPQVVQSLNEYEHQN